MSDIIGFTGTRFIAEHGAALGRNFMSIGRHDGYVTGAGVGYDSAVGMAMALRYPDARHTVLVPTNPKEVNRWWDKPPFSTNPNIEVLLMPEGTDYRDRNQAIVDLSTELRYCALFPEESGKSRRSGTWQTIRMARRKGIPVDGITLNQ